MPWRRLIAPTITVTTAVIVLIGLGVWQIERKTWKEALIDTLAHRFSEAPVSLPPRGNWSKLDQAHDEFRRVTFSADFFADHNAFVYTAGSALRGDVSGPGFWVFTPARLADQGVVVINRGFMPETRRDQTPPPPTHAAMIGVMRWPEQRGMFTPQDDSGRDLWFTRDHTAMARAKNWGETAPFYIELESPSPPSGWPQPGSLKINLSNNHLGYALTWFGLAGGLVAVFLTWAWKQLRSGALPPPDDAFL